MVASCYLPARDMGWFTLKRDPFLGLKSAEREPQPAAALSKDVVQRAARIKCRSASDDPQCFSGADRRVDAAERLRARC
jgi:hypothetical protein